MTRKLASVAAGLLIAGSALLATPGGAAASTPSGEPPVTAGPCQYTATPDDPAVRPVDLPPDPRPTPDTGYALVHIPTNQGLMPLILDRAKAPCTVQSFVHLARSGFYDQTSCHRLTAYDTLKVLQCGDPSGTGSGGPGYRYADELPTDLEPIPGDPTSEGRVYPDGVLAMANAGPDTNGSQWFVGYGDSHLLPNYTVFGWVAWPGTHTLDRIASHGVAPTPEDPEPVDGAPAKPVDLIKVRVFGR